MRLKDLKNKSRIILALDDPGKLKEKKLLTNIANEVAGVKIGLPLVLSRESSDIINTLSDAGAYILADFKLADIPYVMIKTIEGIMDYVNGVISHAFIGREAIAQLLEFLRKHEIELFLVVAMTHKGAEEFINSLAEKFIHIARELGVSGVVAPATFPEKICLARNLLGDAIILSPGVGAQGAEVGSAIKHGADFEIIGRLITESENPLVEVNRINRIHLSILSSLNSNYRKFS
ncbi:MAG: orotidine-5'-phosphate decarboxylase [Crenarchaeota archaeon]|nr:orotidine-5'-phosphate decarboxylase [Thermoproteota archaeon]MCR8454540.1 orotidine-5'-phosphate decarboxylase [Thermoproteota archaeon]MCR8455014.1 orotidine-5'-phosphate decarboxylase [Thermoproteota archaeon]MCR8463264.1 orotidine-5'-phosphate decarboxylase [Thermoproteota archaeon]MCR8470462.1 orotidine-5'-phosphate decarboxylase [Thermoproteota archaeon]